MKAFPTVFVFDDEEPFRNCLWRLFRLAALKVQMFASAPEFLEQYKSDMPGCLVLDVRMPDMNGLELQEMLSARGIEIPIIFLTGSSDVPIAVKAMKAGAFDFIEKPFEHEVLLERVVEAIAFDAENRRERALSGGAQRRLALLTPRERDVLEGIIAGQSNKMIARTLDISNRTVEVYRKRLMDKTRAKSVAELVQLTMDYFKK
jgi:two-component system response regulator FixJ